MMSSRTTYLDNLKIFLTILVIAHHACQAYTIGGDWIVKDLDSASWLSSFLCVNMTFFMGAFFFVSGYFVPKSLQNKSIKEYIIKRAKRLLIPIVFLILVVVPLYYYIAYCHAIKHYISFFDFYIEIYWKQEMVSYDHGWFLISLFIYSMLYILIRKFSDRIKVELTGFLVCILIIVMSIFTFLIRLAYPIDKWIDLFGFIGIDIIEFNMLIDKIESDVKNKDTNAIEKAVELYKGVAFEDSYYSWIVSVQNYFEYKYTQLVSDLIAYYQIEKNEKKVRYFEEKLKNV